MRQALVGFGLIVFGFSNAASADCSVLRDSVKRYLDKRIGSDGVSSVLRREVSGARGEFRSQLDWLEKIAPHEFSLDGTRANDSSWSAVATRLQSLNFETDCIWNQAMRVLKPSAKQAVNACIVADQSRHSAMYSTSRRLDRVVNGGHPTEIFKLAFAGDLRMRCLSAQ